MGRGFTPPPGQTVPLNLLSGGSPPVFPAACLTSLPPLSQALLSAEGGAAALDLFTRVLPACGCATQQMDLLEVIIQCAKHDLLT